MFDDFVDWCNRLLDRQIDVSLMQQIVAFLFVLIALSLVFGGTDLVELIEHELFQRHCWNVMTVLENP